MTHVGATTRSPRRFRFGMLLCLAAFLVAVLGATASPAAATGTPAWDVRATWGDTNLPPGGGELGAGSLLRPAFESSAVGWRTARGTFNGTPVHPAGVAVDSATGNVYVVDVTSLATGGATLRAYDAEGNELGTPCSLQWAPGTPLPQLALDSSGDLYYPNTAAGTVQKLEPDCTEVSLAHPITGLTDPNSVVLDSAGDIYVVDGTTDGSHIAAGRLQKYAPDGTLIGAFAGLNGATPASGEVTSVAVDRSSGDVFVGRGWGQSFHIQRYDSTGTMLQDFGAGAFATRSASNYAHDQLALIYNQLAIDEGSKKLYAADAASLGQVEVFEVEGGAYVHFKAPLVTAGLTAAVAVHQGAAGYNVYAASVGSLDDLGQFTVQPRNVGTAVSDETLTITDELPQGVTATHVEWDEQILVTEVYFFGTYYGSFNLETDFNQFCSGEGTETATCTLPETLEQSFYGGLLVEKSHPARQWSTYGVESSSLPGWNLTHPIFIDVEVAKNSSGAGTNVARAEGGNMAQPFVNEDEVPFSNTPASFGVVPSSFATNSGSFATDVFTAAYPEGVPSRQAGDHPFDYRVDFELSQYSTISQMDGTRSTDGTARLRTAEVTLPRGLIGNPQVMPKCDPVDFAKHGAGDSGTGCPADTQVGYLNASLGFANANYGRGGFLTGPNGVAQWVPIYNLVPPKGTPVDLSFNAAGYVIGHIYAALDPAQNYAIKSVTPDISSLLHINTRATEVTLWGVPGDPAHDKFRYYPEPHPTGQFNQYGTEIKAAVGAPWGTAPIRPFFTNPMDCGFDNGGDRIRLEGYKEPGVFSPVQEYPDPLNVEGCNDPRFRFGPDITMQPTDRHAGAPTGLDVHLKDPLRNDEVREADELYAQNGHVKGISTPPMKKVVVTFPEGMTLNPSAAQGLTGCTLAQIGLGTDSPVRCPDSSQYGTLVLHTPLLPVNEQPSGFIYITKQNENPFHNFLSLYMVIEEPQNGVLFKIPGRLDLDQQTGRLTVTFDDLPQFPLSDFQMTIKSGVRAGLVQPTTCGEKTIRAEFFSWQDPTTPHVVADHYDVTEKPDGSPCVTSLAQRPFNPQLNAGTLNPAAGAYSPFLFRLTRTDDDQEFSQLGAHLPAGLTSKIAGISYCPEAGIAQALARERVAGDGAIEQADPSCPLSSQLGTTEVGTGVGVPLSYVPGKIYLAGPYRGAPLSIVVISPAIVGPYDLGVITVRTAIGVDPETAEISAISEPFPLIFQGIPVRIRDIRLRIDRPETMLNPTSCAEKQITAHVTGTGGNLASTADDTGADLSQRFQAADCASLGFKPKLSLRLYGGTHRNAHPKLRAVLRMPVGNANIAWAQVAMPHAEFLDQSHINTVCTKVQFAAGQCPPGSLIGHAEASTPLLDQPLKGPVYLRSSSHKLPDVVAQLMGQVIVDQVATIDSVNGGLRATFEAVPDAPIDSFTLTMQGGKTGLLVNSEELCGQTLHATADFKAQNGLQTAWAPKIQDACAKRGKHRHGKR